MRDALSRHASHAATTRCETLVFDRIATPSTCRRCGARPARAHLATTFATTHRKPLRGRSDDTRENPHARRKAACDKALRHAMKSGGAHGARAAQRATRCYRGASRHHPAPSPRVRRRAHRRRPRPSRHRRAHRGSTSPRAWSRSVRECRSSDAPTQRFAIREHGVDARSTLDRRSIDDRRGRSTARWTARSASRSAAPSTAPSTAIDHHRRSSTVLDRHRSPSLCPPLTVGRWRTPLHPCRK